MEAAREPVDRLWEQRHELGPAQTQSVIDKMNELTGKFGEFRSALDEAARGEGTSAPPE